MEQGGLACAVGADEPDDAPPRDGEGAVLQRPAAAIALADIVGGKSVVSHATSSSADVRNVDSNSAAMLSSSRPARRALVNQRFSSVRRPLCAASVESANERVTKVPSPGRPATSPSCSSS